MSDGTFTFRPVLKQADLDYINKLAKKNEVLSVSGLDHTTDQHGYYCSTLVYADVLGILFERFNVESNDPSVVFLFRRSGRDWEWREGLEYGPAPEHDDMWAEINHLVVEREDEWEAKQKAK